MSSVSNVIVTCALGDEDAFEKMCIVAFGHLHNLKSVAQVAGGNKHLEQLVYVGAINYLNVDDFVQCVKIAEWEQPECVAVFIKEQEDERFIQRYP
jgi:hypothetical protein